MTWYFLCLLFCISFWVAHFPLLQLVYKGMVFLSWILSKGKNLFIFLCQYWLGLFILYCVGKTNFSSNCAEQPFDCIVTCKFSYIVSSVFHSRIELCMDISPFSAMLFYFHQSLGTWKFSFFNLFFLEIKVALFSMRFEIPYD